MEMPKKYSKYFTIDGGGYHCQICEKNGEHLPAFDVWGKDNADSAEEHLQNHLDNGEGLGRKQSQPRTRTTCSYIGQNFFADAVFMNGGIKFLLVKTDGSVEFADEIVGDDGKPMKPVSGDIDARLLRLPAVSEITPFSNEDVLKLYAEVQETIQKIWDGGDPKNIELLSLWICASYRFDLVGVAPYLRLRGPYGTGKTRALDVISHLALRPLAIGPSLTEAVVFRLCEIYKPCACLNEFDEKGKGDYSSLAIQLLNSRYERGHPIPRIGGENNEKLELFDPFGPTAFSARSPFADASLESRCLEILCQETERDDIAAILSPEQFEALFAPLRNLLYVALRVGSNAINKTNLPNECAMPKRFRQLLTALWAATHPALLPKLEALITQLKMEEQERLANSDEGEVWWQIFERASEKGKEFVITGADVGNILGLETKGAARSGGRRLSAMGFFQGKRTARTRPWMCTEKLWAKMLQRVGYPKPVAFPWRFSDISSDVSDVSDAKKGDVEDANSQGNLSHLLSDATNDTNDEGKRH